MDLTSAFIIFSPILLVDPLVDDELVDACVTALDSSTQYSIESIFHSIRLILPKYIERHEKKVRMLNDSQSETYDSSPAERAVALATILALFVASFFPSFFFQSGSFSIDLLEPIYHASLTAFRDVHLELSTFTPVLAFLALVRKNDTDRLVGGYR